MQRKQTCQDVSYIHRKYTAPDELSFDILSIIHFQHASQILLHLYNIMRQWYKINK